MDQQDILKELQSIFVQVFNRPDIQIENSTKAEDVEGWDSLNHAILMDQIEKHFELRFDLMDMLKMQTVADICTLIEAKKA
ncbi:MAG: acyl carrier protein [Bacteroidota bacterium]